MSGRTDADTIADEAPWSDALTDYDRSHFVVYLRLLDAQADGAADQELCRVILGIDPVADTARAEKALKSHLRRARWMTEQGFRDLLRGT